MKGVLIVAGFIVLFALLFLVGAYICFRMAFHIDRAGTFDQRRLMSGPQYDAIREKMLGLVDHALTFEFEDVEITSKDGLKLYGRYYEVQKGAPIQLMFHGYGSPAIRDFCGGLPLALESGHNALVVDQRAHGKSEGRCATFGIKEREDCLCWIDYVLKRFGKDTKIVLVGVSMGAATVLMVSEMNLPDNVKAIAADCPYSSPRSIIEKVISEMHVPVGIGYFMVSLGARIFGGFNPDACSATEALKHAKTPVLLIHGEDDRLVPCEMSREMFKACASKKVLLTVPDAGHGLSYLIDEEKYKETVKAFVEECL